MFSVLFLTLNLFQYAGGLFAKLESQWKTANIQPPRSNNPPFR